MHRGVFRLAILCILTGALLNQYSCKHANHQLKEVKNFTQFIHDTAQENNYKPLILHNPQTFETCNVYKEADTSSQILEVLKPFTSFKEANGVEIAMPDTIRAFGDIPEQYSTYTVVWAEVVTLNGIKGYVKPDKLALWTYENSNLHVRYLIGDHSVGKKRDWMTRFAKLDPSTNKIISQVERPASSSEFERYVNEIKNLPLRNVRYALRLYSHGDFCGGGNESDIMIDTPDGLSFLPVVYNFNDDSGGINSDAEFIPSINRYGALKLYADGDPGDKQHPSTSITYPKDLKVPIKDLIVEQTESGSLETDKNGEIVTDKKGNEIIANLERATIYYRWDGHHAVKLSEKKVKVK